MTVLLCRRDKKSVIYGLGAVDGAIVRVREKDARYPIATAAQQWKKFRPRFSMVHAAIIIRSFARVSSDRSPMKEGVRFATACS